MDFNLNFSKSIFVGTSQNSYLSEHLWKAGSEFWIMSYKSQFIINLFVLNARFLFSASGGRGACQTSAI